MAEEEAIRAASEELACQFQTLINTQEVESIRHIQHLILGRLQDSNAVLSHFNEYSERCFTELSGDFSRNTRLLKSIKSDLDYIFMKLRWNEIEVRQLPTSTISTYRDELDGLLHSQVIWEPYTPHVRGQVANICLMGENIWMARVPLISWTRVEWHLPDRVIRQFGYVPSVDIFPLDPSFLRLDGRGKFDTDWMVYYNNFIDMWENRRACIVEGIPFGPDSEHLIHRYLHWFRSWATLYMLKPPLEPPTTYYQRAPIERHLRNYFLDSETTLQPFFGRHDLGAIQPAIDHMEELIQGMRQHMHIEDDRYREGHTMYSYFSATPSSVQPQSMMAGPSSYEEHCSAQNLFFQPTTQETSSYPTDDYVPTTIPSTEEEPILHNEQLHELRGRPLRAPQHYTPGTDAIPRRTKKKH